MNANFTIDVEPERDLVRITLGGFFTAADVNDFLAVRDKAHHRLTCGPNQHLTLADVREMRIQPQEAVGRFGAMLADPRQRSRKLAFVFASTLARGQLMRAAEGRHARFFTDMDEAKAWLFEADDQIAA